MGNPFVADHFKAVVFRRFVVIKRSWKTVLISMLATVVFSALAIAQYYMMKSMMVGAAYSQDFSILVNQGNGLNFASVGDNDEKKRLRQHVIDMFHEDTGRTAEVSDFEDLDEMNEKMYKNSEDMTGPEFVVAGLDFKEVGPDGNVITVLWNSSDNRGTRGVVTLIPDMEWREYFKGGFELEQVALLRRLMDQIFGMMAPMLISYGLISIVPLIMSPVIVDISGEVRQYMVSCTLSILCYWVGTFLVDFIIWIIVVTVIWVLFNAAMIVAFHDNLFNMWYGFVMMGPSLILMVYCMSFMFTSPEAAARQAFMIFVIMLMVPMIVDLVSGEPCPVWLNWVWSLFPVLHGCRLLTLILPNIGTFSQPLSYYWKNDNTQGYLIMQWVNIVIYGGILWLIERLRIGAARRRAKKSFGDYGDFFKEVKARHPVSQEARDMEDEVRDSHNYAVRCENVSRLFFNTAGDPIPAVNCVSLGVKEGALFGFLGANGAGKTTLIKMITSMLPPSAGTIEILGEDITKMTDLTCLSICPQFNTHLCDEMTPYEHFVLYCLLFRLSKEDSKSETERLISVMDLEGIKDKPLRELSGGDVRKLAIAMSFLGPAKIILLDEPTASLDPVARRHVHEMITEFKGDKTFMLCTHLLSEAESLCDNISIMVKGCVYTVGSPQYLSEKFGTEYKVDIMLEDDTEETARKVTDFMTSEVASAELSICRPTARIYNVPAASMELHELFTIMAKGKESGTAGFTYYTCSSSSLERVFMEIVRMSEHDDIAFAQEAEKKDEKSGSEKSKSSKSGSEGSTDKEGKSASKSEEKSKEKNAHEAVDAVHDSAPVEELNSDSGSV